MLESNATFLLSTEEKPSINAPLYHTAMHGALPRMMIMEIIWMVHGDIVDQTASQILRVRVISQLWNQQSSISSTNLTVITSFPSVFRVVYILRFNCLRLNLFQMRWRFTQVYSTIVGVWWGTRMWERQWWGLKNMQWVLFLVIFEVH